ncbi:hypothetical protein SDJN02_09784, partial [Cucurbita argyrosperma subsp. argyrosperma]
CIHDMKKHFDESVLSKLPNSYQEILRQSITIEEETWVMESIPLITLEDNFKLVELIDEWWSIEGTGKDRSAISI